MAEAEWTPRHVRVSGKHTGYDFSDLLKSGVWPNVEAYYAWLKANIDPGPPPTYPAKPRVERKPRSNPAPAPAAARAERSNVVALRKPVVEEEDYGFPPEFSEDGLAEKFTARYAATLKYSGPEQTWYVWNQTRWVKDETGEAIDLARKTCKLAAGDLAARLELGPKAEKLANMISTRRVFSNVETICRTDRRHVVLPTRFDQNPWILNTPSGVVDLKTGQLRPARQEDYCTKSTRVAPGGECPKWLDYLNDATEGDPDLLRYLQRIAGYCLTGSISEHIFFFCYGGGGNGKGTYINTLDWLLGSYSVVAQMDTFTETRFTKHSSEIAMFQGARLVTAQETDSGSHWNESRVKALTGGDPITARHMYQSEFTFYPTFKLLFSGNNKPALRNVDDAIKRRMYLIPFEFKVPEEKLDKGLQDYLKEVEGPGILQWAIQGCLDWLQYTLNAPIRVQAATAEYFDEEDRIRSFLDNCCEIGIHYREPTSRLFQRYREWCEDEGDFAFGRRRFLSVLALKGYRSHNLGGQMCLQGLKLPDNYAPGGR